MMVKGLHLGVASGAGAKACRSLARVLRAGLVAMVCAGSAHTALAQPGRVPTVTRLVQLFTQLETQLMAAQRQGDGKTLDSLLSDDFEMRVARQPGVPIARAEWLQAQASAKWAAGEWHIEQMAAVERGEWVTVSFRLAPASTGAAGGWFMVDTWQRQGDGWRLASRHAAAVWTAAPLAPGERASPPMRKKI